MTMEKSALAVEGGGCTPTPYYPITITDKVAMYALAKPERADTFTLFHLYPICTPWFCTTIPRPALSVELISGLHSFEGDFSLRGEGSADLPLISKS